MRRILVVHCPIVRSTAGNSLGPMTISATMAMMAYSDHSMPNTRVISTPRRDDDMGHRTDNDKLYRAVLNTAFLLRRPPLPLGDPYRRELRAAGACGWQPGWAKRHPRKPVPPARPPRISLSLNPGDRLQTRRRQ